MDDATIKWIRFWDELGLDEEVLDFVDERAFRGPGSVVSVLGIPRWVQGLCTTLTGRHSVASHSNPAIGVYKSVTVTALSHTGNTIRVRFHCFTTTANNTTSAGTHKPYIYANRRLVYLQKETMIRIFNRTKTQKLTN
jgi:hypothetical protein